MASSSKAGRSRLQRRATFTFSFANVSVFLSEWQALDQSAALGMAVEFRSFLVELRNKEYLRTPMSC